MCTQHHATSSHYWRQQRINNGQVGLEAAQLQCGVWTVDCGQHNLISRKQMICCLHWPAGNVFITWPGLGLCQKYWMQSTITNSYLVYSPAVSQEFYEKLKPRFVTAALAMHSEYESPQCTGGYSQAQPQQFLYFTFYTRKSEDWFLPNIQANSK